MMVHQVSADDAPGLAEAGEASPAPGIAAVAVTRLRTTTAECVSGLREPDGGTMRLLGLNPRADRAQIREIVGVQLQESPFPAKLRVAFLPMGVGEPCLPLLFLVRT
jgi:hypothetical protein